MRKLKNMSAKDMCSLLKGENYAPGSIGNS
jgi:hypothetical protein